MHLPTHCIAVYISFNREAESEVPAEISAAWTQCLFLQAVGYLDNLPTHSLPHFLCQ